MINECMVDFKDVKKMRIDFYSYVMKNYKFVFGLEYNIIYTLESWTIIPQEISGKQYQLDKEIVVLRKNV